MPATELLKDGETQDALAMTKSCMACGAEMMADATVCAACGTPVTAAVEDAATLDIEVEINIGEPADDEVAEGEMPDDQMPDDQMPEMAALPTWEGELAFEGMETSDGRYLIPGKLSDRNLPLTLMCQTITAEGHLGAEACGKLTQIWRVDRPDLGDGVVAVMGSGEFSEAAAGPLAAQLLAEQVLRGVSVDLAPSAKMLVDRETKEIVTEEDADYETYLSGGYLVGFEAEIMGATLVPFPAFADASLRIVNDAESVVASAFGTMRLIPVAITASAAGIAPLAPPRDWFFTPEPEGKMPLTVTDDGQIYGHLATWDQCHHGFVNECVLARPSRTEYAMFHVGAIRTAEGEMVNVGRIVVGDSGHASVNYPLQAATEHYDKTATVGAFVRAIDGRYGIWLSGAVRSDCPAERVRDMLANPPSGDWRNFEGSLELIASLSVPVPGFPIPRYEFALTASATEVTEVRSLVATGYYELEPPTMSRAQIRRKEMLLREAATL